MLLSVMPGPEFQGEVEANAAMGGNPPEYWLSRAVTHTVALLRTLKDGEGYLVVGKGNELKQFVDGSISEYRQTKALRAYTGFSPQDLGGYPPGTPIWSVPVDDAVVEELKSLAGADSTEEAVGYAIWRQSRFFNTLREDLPGWEPGIVLADGVFRSLTIVGAFKRLPGTEFEPVVPKHLSIETAIQAWLRLLTDREPEQIDLQGKRRTDPNFWKGLLACRLDRPSGPRNRSVSGKVLDIRPILEVIITGPSPADASLMMAWKHERSSFHRKREDAFRITMPDLLHDPAPLAEIQAHLKRQDVPVLIASAGVVGCPHGLEPLRRCARCPAWQR